MNRPVDVFIAYSPTDERLFHEFSIHLKSLRGKFINSWSKGEILGGEIISRAIENNIKNTDLVLAMVSSDFLAGEYSEINAICEKHKKVTIPIKLRPFPETGEFNDLQFLPKGGKAITTYASLDVAFKEVVEGILEIIQKLGKRLDYEIKKTFGIKSLKELSFEKILSTGQKSRMMK